MFAQHFFQEIKFENMSLSAVPTTKNVQEENCDMRDFAADTLLKNGTGIQFNADTLSDANLPDLKNICHLRDFAADTLEKTAPSQISHRTP